MKDSGNFDNGLFHLVYGDVGQRWKRQFPSTVHPATRAAGIGELSQPATSMVDGQGLCAALRQDCPSRPNCKCVRGRPPRPQTIGSASRLEETTETFAHLLMTQELAALQGSLASLYCLDEAIFLCEVACHNVFDDFARVATMFAGKLRETRLQIGREVHFHALTIRHSWFGGNGELVFGLRKGCRNGVEGLRIRGAGANREVAEPASDASESFP